jgi:DNA-3-methyladenine glycosylase
MNKLPLDFYRRNDVLSISRELLGKLLVTRWAGTETIGRIVECEAYAGVMDKASHASGGRRTARNEVMYGPAGFSYVYLCYGIHHLFNIVTNEPGIPHAVLIRAVEPVKGIKHMLSRTGKEKTGDFTLTRGPGNVSKALGILTVHSGISLRSRELFVADDGFIFPSGQITTSPRIGVEYAGSDANLPYRFFIKGSPYVSGRKKVI